MLRIGWWYPAQRLDTDLHLLRTVHAVPPRLLAYCGTPLSTPAPAVGQRTIPQRSRWCAQCLRVLGALRVPEDTHAPDATPVHPVDAGLSMLAHLAAHQHTTSTGTEFPAATLAEIIEDLERGLRLLRAAASRLPDHTGGVDEHGWMSIAGAAAHGTLRALHAGLNPPDSDTGDSGRGVL